MDAELYVTACAIAAVLRVPLGTIHRWANEDGWTRTSKKRRPVRYRYEDACGSYAKREAERKRRAEDGAA